MSNAAKSAEEIEDVLASIRRLVAGPGIVCSAPGDDPGPDRLVLTPALRVSEPDDPWAPIAAPADAAPADAAALASDDRADPSWGLEDRLADWGEISDSAEEAVSDAIAEGHGEALAENDGPAMTIRFSRRTPPRDMPEFEPEAGDANWPDAGADNALRDLVLARGLAVDEGQGEGGGDDPAPRAEAADAPAGAMGGEDHGAEHLEPATAQSDAQGEVAVAAAPEVLSPPARDEDHFWPASDPEVASDRRDPARDTGFDREEELMRAADAQTEPEIEDFGEAAAPFSFPDPEEGLLDEETLREIVAEVVRQELQGALGQSITRNVRKMVRREIRLALAAAELE